MMAIERATLLNSNDTLLVNDYDLSSFDLFFSGGSGGVLFSDLGEMTEFSITGTTAPSISKGSAIIVCTRPASTPITNEKIAVRYSLGSTKSFNGAVSGSKIYIEINQDLINDPTLIEDAPGSTDYAMGLNIGVMSMSLSYPTNPYIPLYSYNGSARTDLRTHPTIDGKMLILDSLTGDIITTGDITADRVKSAHLATEDDDVINKEYLDAAFANLGGSIPHSTNAAYGTSKIATDAVALARTNQTDTINSKQRALNVNLLTGTLSTSTPQTIAHGLGTIPRVIMFQNIYTGDSSPGFWDVGTATYDGTSIKQKVLDRDEGQVYDGVVRLSDNDASTSSPIEYSMRAVSAVDTTNITLTYTSNGNNSPGTPPYVIQVIA